MYMDSPVAALAGARRAMVPEGVLVAAVLAEPERCSYFSLPRRVLEKYRPLPPIDPASPGPFRYADVERLRQDLERADLNIEHVEELVLSVMEAETAPEVIAWVRAFGLTRLLNDLPNQPSDRGKRNSPKRRTRFARTVSFGWAARPVSSSLQSVKRNRLYFARAERWQEVIETGTAEDGSRSSRSPPPRPKPRGCRQPKARRRRSSSTAGVLIAFPPVALSRGSYRSSTHGCCCTYCASAIRLPDTRPSSMLRIPGVMSAESATAHMAVRTVADRSLSIKIPSFPPFRHTRLPSSL
jgi:hypothetical protein